MTNKTQIQDYKLWIFVDETIPIWFKIEKDNCLSLNDDWTLWDNDRFYNKLIKENRYEIIDIDTYFEKWWSQSIFKDGFKKMISEKWNVSEFKLSYNIDLSIIFYKWEIEELIDRIKLEGYDKLKSNNNIIEVAGINIDKESFNFDINDYVRDYEINEENRFEMLVSFFNNNTK